MQAHGLSSRGAVAALHGVAKLHTRKRCPEGQLLLQHLAAKGLRDPSGHVPPMWSCVNFLWASAMLQLSPSPKLLDEAVQLLTANAAGSYAMSTALWALGKRQYYPGRDAVNKFLAATVRAQPLPAAPPACAGPC